MPRMHHRKPLGLGEVLQPSFWVAGVQQRQAADASAMQDGASIGALHANAPSVVRFPCGGLVEPRGIEPLTFALRTRRSPS